MNQKVKNILNDVLQKKHHEFWQKIDTAILDDFTLQLKDQNLSDVLRAEKRLTWVLENEKPVILPDERIVFTRTVPKIPAMYTPEEWATIKENHYIHELGNVCNICSNFSYTIEVGLEQRRIEVLEAIEAHKASGDAQGAEYLLTVVKSIDDIENLTDRYAELALSQDRKDIYDVLTRVPRYGARSFREALQSFRILHFTLWVSGNYHNTIGRFDQYMFKYLKKDMDLGILDHESALDMLEEFFLTFNKDSDLYPGMQQGDNGQSLVIGGVDSKGNEAYNMLSELCMKASLELKLIDPKINLRVNHNTPFSVYDLGTELTKQGLGFPQYSNDDVVIPGLLSKGYELEDARNYVVAACWEFIIPGCAMDIPNIAALSFARVVDTCVHKYLETCNDFDALMAKVKEEIGEELAKIVSEVRNIYMEPAPFQTLLMEGCIENASDISLGAKYNNYGIHGTGLSTAVDSLAAIKKYVFEEKTVEAKDIVHAIDFDFDGQYELWHKLRYNAPKMGNDDDYADAIAVTLFDNFSEMTKDLKNERGGCFRPGSGSAMYYIWHAKELGASADGRKKGEPLSANFSPSLNVKVNGPLSIIKSFSKPNMKNIMNGGPLTLELHDTVFRNLESIHKVSSLIKLYMEMGGQQIQINAVNREELIDAKIHPELHKNLIVRVWGWSGYFVELDEQYQDHIIKRVELNVK